jgi:protein-tyrosine phosphatase
MPHVVAWPSDPHAEATADLVQRLRAGEILGVPSEAGHLLAASARQPETLRRLTSFAAPARPLAVVLSSPLEALDWLPFLRGAALRLARTFWPGPLILHTGGGGHEGAARWLSAEVQAWLLRERGLAMIVPEHPAAGILARQMNEPMCAVPATADLLHEAALVIDGPESSAGGPTVVQVRGREAVVVVAEGAIPAASVAEAAPCRVLFVCTGNTCRSPLAQALCVKLLADLLGCRMDEVAGRGYRVQSAGLAAMAGLEASPEAIETASSLGADLREHRTQPLTLDLLAQADLLYAMTRAHLQLLHSLRIEVGPRPQLLSPRDEDVSDPFGADAEAYRGCADQIRMALQERLAEIREA